MSTTKTEIEQHYLEANAICKTYPKLKCMEAANHLMYCFQHLGATRSLHINVHDKSFNGYIASNGRDIAHNGEHWGVMLHNHVFDNLHPGPNKLSDWLKLFAYMDKSHNFTKICKGDVVQRTYKDHRAYTENIDANWWRDFENRIRDTGR